MAVLIISLILLSLLWQAIGWAGFALIFIVLIFLGISKQFHIYNVTRTDRRTGRVSKKRVTVRKIW
jgi:hypothetical protein